MFPDDKESLTSGLDGRVICWDRPTGTINEMIDLRPARLPGQPLIKPVVYLSVDAKRATGVRLPSEVFDLETAGDLFVIPPPSTPPAVSRITVSADGLKAITVSRSADRTRRGSCVVWDLMTTRQLGEFEIPPSRITPLAAISPSGNRVVIITVGANPAGGAALPFVTGFDLRTGKKLSDVEDPAFNGSVFLSAADDRAAVLCSTDGRLWSVDFEAGKVNPDIDRLPTRGEPAVHAPVAVSPDGTLIATGVVGNGLEDYGVRVYDLKTGRRTHTFMGHLGPVMALRFTPDGKGVASGAQDTSVIVWDLTKPQPGK